MHLFWTLYRYYHHLKAKVEKQVIRSEKQTYIEHELRVSAEQAATKAHHNLNIIKMVMGSVCADPRGKASVDAALVTQSLKQKFNDIMMGHR